MPEYRIPYNVNFCLFCDCYYLHNGEVWDCTRDSCVVNKTIVDWWAMSLLPRPLISSNPPEGKKKVTNIYYDPLIEKYTIEREE